MVSICIFLGLVDIVVEHVFMNYDEEIKKKLGSDFYQYITMIV